MNKLWFGFLFLGSAVQGMRGPVSSAVALIAGRSAALSTEIAYQEGKVGVWQQKYAQVRQANDRLQQEIRAMNDVMDDLRLVRILDRREFAIRHQMLINEIDRKESDAQRSRDWGMELARINESLHRRLRSVEAELEQYRSGHRALVPAKANLPIPMPPQ